MPKKSTPSSKNKAIKPKTSTYKRERLKLKATVIVESGDKHDLVERLSEFVKGQSTKKKQAKKTTPKKSPKSSTKQKQPTKETPLDKSTSSKKPRKVLTINSDDSNLSADLNEPILLSSDCSSPTKVTDKDMKEAHIATIVRSKLITSIEIKNETNKALPRSNGKNLLVEFNNSKKLSNEEWLVEKRMSVKNSLKTSVEEMLDIHKKSTPSNTWDTTKIEKYCKELENCLFEETYKKSENITLYLDRFRALKSRILTVLKNSSLNESKDSFINRFFNEHISPTTLTNMHSNEFLNIHQRIEIQSIQSKMLTQSIKMSSELISPQKRVAE